MLYFGFVYGLWLSLPAGAARLDFRLFTSPLNVTTIDIPFSGEAPVIMARTSQRYARSVWQLEGPGTLLEQDHPYRIEYLPPDQLDSDKEEARIVFRVTDAAGETQEHSVTFVVRRTMQGDALPSSAASPRPNSTPALAPSPTPTPIPTPTSSEIQEVPELDLTCPETDTDVDTLIRVALPQALAEYQALKEQEPADESVRKQLQTTLAGLWCDLRVIEAFLQAQQEGNPDKAVQMRLEGIQTLRRTCEQEFNELRGKQSH
jgi:hypothetical protein